MVALNTAYAAPKNAADPKNRVGDFFYEDHASVGKNRWASRLNAQEKSCYHYETASGRSNWPNRDPIAEQGSIASFEYRNKIKALISFLFNESRFNKEDIAEVFLTLAILNELLSIPYEFLDDANLRLFVRNNPTNQLDVLGLSIWDETKQRLGASKDFVDGYREMREANWKGSDKYFHCKANCNAAKRGKHGADQAEKISDAREAFDEKIKGNSKEECDADQEANRHGREKGSEGEDCKNACDKYRPQDLPDKY